MDTKGAWQVVIVPNEFTITIAFEFPTGFWALGFFVVLGLFWLALNLKRER